ncbi:MAG: response regulator [Lachnospiraceae bacterium]|nr:response regulator [Lachnospiraceae bacterium]MBR4994294.1 response regulator [Lachnospiraceae bacterium]
MSEKIYFIGNDKAFMVNALADGLKREGITCDIIPFDSQAIGKHMLEDRAFLFHVDEDVMDNKVMLNYMSSACAGTGMDLFIIGYPEFTKAIRAFIPRQFIHASIDQPISAKDLAEKLRWADDEDAERDGKKHVLVVDDSGPTLHAVRGWLAPKYKVSIVDSAASAMAFLGQTRPDLILLDYEMPICGGPQMLEMIRAEKETARIPVMFLTAKDDKDSVQKVISLNPQGYILKSLPPEKIVSIVDKFFEKK